MLDSLFPKEEKYLVHFNFLLFKPLKKQVIYYDPQPDSECSKYIKSHLKSIKAFFRKLNFAYEFCYLPEMVGQLTEEQIRYRYPNWNGEPLQTVGNDLLKPFLSKKNRDIKACFLHLYDTEDNSFSYYPLKDFSEVSLKSQLMGYHRVLDDDFWGRNHVDFSISDPEDDYNGAACMELNEEQAQYLSMQKKFSYDIEEDFEKESEKVMSELWDYLCNVRMMGISEFVLNCAMPIEKRLSRLVVDEKYNIILPDFKDLHIDLGPLPKAIFLLFLKHEEVIVFKCMSDYREELERYYRAVTNRVAKSVIESSLDAVTDPTKNILNEKCSLIRKAFVMHMDKVLADNYCITGERGECKRITLPRDLVEWRCKI